MIYKKITKFLPTWFKDILYKNFFALKFFFKNKFLITKNVDLSHGNSQNAFNFSFKSRQEFFQSCRYYLQYNRVKGVYTEFGCCGANTFRISLNTLGLYGKPHDIHHFYAFDSFEGMPEPQGIDKALIWKKGICKITEKDFIKLLKNDSHRVTTVKGFYEDSLKNFKFPDNTKIAMAYIDCDYYSSTKTVLNFLEKHLSHGMILAFDDWDCYFADNKRGQRLAFLQWSRKIKRKYVFEEFRRMNSGGNSFIVQELKKIGTDFRG